MAESGYDPRGWATPTDSPTIHPDAHTTDSRADRSTPERRGLNPIALLVGLVSVVVAALAMASPATLASADPRWVLAGAAVVVGAGALLCAARR